MKRRRLPPALAGIALAIVAIVEVLTAIEGSQSAVDLATRCVRTSANVKRYCGPATARLSVFPAVIFKGGMCTRKRVDGVHLFQVRIGARALDGSDTHDGLSYLSLGIAGSRSQPKSGNVIAYYRSKRWVGRGVSFKGGADLGTIVAQGVARSWGRARASYRC
jgi:hypothetical protein